MSLLSFLTAPFIDSVGSAIDSIVTSDEERLALRNKLEDIKTNADLQFEHEISERHKSDMQSDDILSKRIRPMSLIYLMFIYSVLALTDGNIAEFAIKEVYIDGFTFFTTGAIGFYFFGRSAEKMKKNN